MAKIITVYGNAGSGKTIFSCVLARILANKKKANPKKVIVCSPNLSTPMIPILMPEQKRETEGSLDSLLNLSEIGAPEIAGQVVLLQTCPYIGVLGYNENKELDLRAWEKAKILSLLDGAASLVDYLILDCTTELEIFTQIAVEKADLRIQIITPDLRGLQYYACQMKNFQDKKYQFEKHCVFSGLARPYHALDEIAYVVENYMGYLPFQKEIDKCAVEGGYFDAYSQCGKKYLEMVESVAAKLQS